jgi:hypothetical protein
MSAPLTAGASTRSLATMTFSSTVTTTAPWETSSRPRVDGVAVGGQEQTSRVHQLAEDQHVAVGHPKVVVGYPKVTDAVDQAAHRDLAKGAEEDVDAAV